MDANFPQLVLLAALFAMSWPPLGNYLHFPVKIRTFFPMLSVAAEWSQLSGVKVSREAGKYGLEGLG